VGVGYALSIGGLLAPMYLAKAIANPKGDIGTPARAAMLAGICLGPSLGFGYGRAYRTALVSALLKTAIVAGALYADEATLPADGSGHAYLTALAAGGVFVWSVVDVIRLGGVIREQNQLHAPPPRALVPYVTLAGRAPQVGVLGRF
jgi:hypothetical protein